jgi:hypothetical protein
MGAAVKLSAFAALLAVCGTASARDAGQIPTHSDPGVTAWFRTAKSPSGTSCCDEADGYREGVAVKIGNGEPTVIFRSRWVHLTAITSVWSTPRTSAQSI